MDVEILARLQFAITIMFHYIYPPLSIGLGLILVLIEIFDRLVEVIAVTIMMRN